MAEYLALRKVGVFVCFILECAEMEEPPPLIRDDKIILSWCNESGSRNIIARIREPSAWLLWLF